MSDTPTVPLRWLADEAARIRRERRMRRIEAGAAIVCLAVWVVMLVRWIALMIR